jgi:hypothetical protein
VGNQAALTAEPVPGVRLDNFPSLLPTLARTWRRCGLAVCVVRLFGVSPSLNTQQAGKISPELAHALAATQMALQRVASVLPLAQAEARKLGLEFDGKTPGALAALRECLKSYRKAWQSIRMRDLGEVLETLSPQSPQRLSPQFSP